MPKSKSTINKIILTAISSFASCIVYSQIKDVEKVISGDYSSIKNNNIKIIRLKSDSGETINEVLVSAEKDELLVTNNNHSFLYKLNEFGNPQYIIIGQNCFSINYFDKSMAKSITKTSMDGYSIQSTCYPDSKNLLTVYNKSLKISEKNSLYVKSHNYIHNAINPELSYTENIDNSKILRDYKNGNKVVLINNDQFRSIDSTYLNNNKYYRYYHFKENDKDSIVNEKDSVFTQVMKNGKITYENSYFESDIIFEKKYSDGILISDTEYFYRPYFENKIDAIPNGIVLWEVKTTLKDKRSESEFPLKKYYKLKNGKLIENPKNKLVHVQACGVPQRENKRYYRFQTYNISSVSIVFDKKSLETIQRSINIDSENELNYCRYDFQQGKCIFQIGEKFRVTNRIITFTLGQIQSKNYKIEIIKDDNTVYPYKLNDFINLIGPIVDIISIEEE
ncbi:hypothetical protein [Flavobacterium pallidum]|uniref:Uncharacterized protein n=1 Tax=Flavobacterium pallidum TaxID=2172098 RepID=A0A2S1SKQ1_9FLAO|nr:hypothetical protein [Flavobacterium pallidum]AWI26917.1 hypothetical protein HYN49_13945 [Flavobacterium pallidum]